MAYSGSPPGHVPLSNTFDWVFSNPFCRESDYTPQSQLVPRIEDDRPIFVDYKSGMCSSLALGRGFGMSIPLFHTNEKNHTNRDLKAPFSHTLAFSKTAVQLRRVYDR